MLLLIGQALVLVYYDFDLYPDNINTNRVRLLFITELYDIFEVQVLANNQSDKRFGFYGETLALSFNRIISISLVVMTSLPVQFKVSMSKRSLFTNQTSFRSTDRLTDQHV